MKKIVMALLLLSACGEDYNSHLSNLNCQESKCNKCYKKEVICHLELNEFYNQEKCNQACDVLDIMKFCNQYVEKCTVVNTEVRCISQKDGGVLNKTDSNIGGMADLSIEKDIMAKDTDNFNDMLVFINNDLRVKIRIDGSITSFDAVKANTEEDQEIVGGGGCNISDSKIGILGIIVLLLFLLARVKIFTIIVLLYSVTSYAAPSIHRNSMASTSNDFINISSAEVLKHLNFSTQMLFSYEHKPLRLVNKHGQTVENIIDFRQTLESVYVIGLYDNIELSINVPIMLGQNVNKAHLLSNLSRFDLNNSDFGDVRIIPKIKLFDFKFIKIGAALPFTLTTGNVQSLFGEDGATISPMLLATFYTKYINVGINYGFLLRKRQNFIFKNQNISSGHNMLYGLGISVPIVKKYGYIKRLDLIADVSGSNDMYQFDKEEFNVEASGGFRMFLKNGLFLNFGIGGGLTKGYGVPQYRILWGIGWQLGTVNKKCRACSDKRIYVTKIVKKVIKEVKIEKQAIVLPMVYFDTDSSNLRSDSIQVLDKVARMIKDNPWVTKIRLEGHCDHRGSNKYNHLLSIRRVDSVVEYFKKNGINIMMLDKRYYGKTQLITPDKTERSLQENRRVEFHIIGVK